MKNWFYSSALCVCVPLDFVSSAFPLDACELPYSTLNILGLVPSQHEFPLYLFEFCQVPRPESPLLPVEKSLQVTGYPGFVVWVTADRFSGNGVVHEEPDVLRDTVHNGITVFGVELLQCIPVKMS